MERVEGEAVLFLGPKSKHTQFGKMCLDPRNEKFKVEKEEDLQVNKAVITYKHLESRRFPLPTSFFFVNTCLGFLGCNGIAINQILL